MPSPERVRTYRDHLTPALHDRFTRAACIVFAVCYLESLIISRPTLLWCWNPISFHGARAILLFASCLAVFIVRVSNIHVGRRLTRSGAETVYRSLALSTLHTLAWFVFSAWLFGEVYLWTRKPSEHLAWIDLGRPHEWPRLNENPIFLRTIYFLLAAVQTGLHLTRDEDGIELLFDRPLRTNRIEGTPQPNPSALTRLGNRMPAIAGRILRVVFPGLGFAVPLYFLLIRDTIWPYFYTIGRILHRDLATSAVPTGLEHWQQLIWQAASSSGMLLLLWEISNACFSIFVSRPPLKREHPLTSEIKGPAGEVISKSKDPNASLLNGLSSKKEVARSFAYWELYIICSQFPQRLKTIYTEVDRKDGSTWAQTSQILLAEISAISRRIESSQSPTQQQNDSHKDQSAGKEDFAASKAQPNLGLPRIANQSVQQNGEIHQYRKPDFAQSIGNIARAAGQHPNASNPFLPHAKHAIEWGTDRVKERIGREETRANGAYLRLLQTPFGEPLRQTFARKACTTIFGGSRGHKVNVTYASRSLASLCRNALQEDNYGQVAKSVALIVRTYTSALTDIHCFLAALPPSSTDVFFNPKRDRNVAEVKELTDVLKEGLETVLLAYGEYANDIGVTRKEMREAREALGTGQEMGMTHTMSSSGL